MKTKGWIDEPIDTVRMPDGQLTSIDNTRVLAAREAGINLKVKIWDYKDALPQNMLKRFEDPNTPDLFATNWGEAINTRILRQPSSFISNYFPYGSIDDPLILFNTNTSNIRLGI